MDRNRAKADIEWQRGRAAHVDPVHAGIGPTLCVVLAIAGLEVAGFGFMPFWGMLLASAVVFGAVYRYTSQMNEVMRDEIEKRSARR